MSDLIHNLGIDWRLLLANTVTFFIVLWLLRRYAFRPLMGVIEKRQQMATETVAKSKQVSLELKAMAAEKAQVIQAAKTEAVIIMKAAKSQAEQQRQRLLQQTQTETEDLLTRTKQQLNQERIKMVAQARTELADVVVGATARILTDQGDPEADKKLTAQALAALKEIKT